MFNSNNNFPNCGKLSKKNKTYFTATGSEKAKICKKLLDKMP